MKYLLTLFFAFALLINVEAQDTGIQFSHTNWEETLKQAKAEDKLIFVDAYTDWCGPCKWMTANVFPTKEAGKLYNDKFINVKIDMEKGEGILFAKAYKVNAFPTLLFIDAKGNMVHKALGSRDAAKFVSLGEAALDPEQQVGSLMAKYENGERSPEFLKSYAEVVSGAGMGDIAAAAAEEYLTSQSDWNTEENMNFIFKLADYYGGKDSKMTQHVIDNRASYQKLLGNSEVDSRLSAIPYMQLRKIGKNPSRAQIEEAYKTVFPTDYVQHSDQYQMQSLMYSKKEGDQEAFFASAVKYMDTYQPSDWGMLNSIAWRFYELTDDEALLLKARAWAKKSVELDGRYMNHDTLAAICFKLKEKDLASKHAMIAIELAKKDGSDAKETEELLEKINAL